MKLFLKPDCRKVAIFVILFIILFYSFDGKYPINYMYIAIGGLVDGSLVGLGYGYNWFIFILDIFIWAIISYLFSCLIVWIYDKFKNVKKKK